MRLEQAIGAEAFLELIERNGTVFELFKIIEYASAALAEQMIEALDSTRVRRLVQAGNDQHRSIGTLNFTLRKLRKDPERRVLGERLEQAIGEHRLWELVLETGSPGPFCDLMDG